MALAMGMASATLLRFPQVSLKSSSSVHLSFSQSKTLGATSLSLTLSPTPSYSISSPLYIICGRGDKKTARGKRFKHSYGNARPHNKNKGRGPQRVPVPPAPPRKDKFDDGEITPVEIDDSLFTSDF